ncbi:MAG TPA: metal-dependent hydrolase [Sulfurospirillum arcachonense]|nr:metal-dependent hydrolase [Sulfurospirillum arcachonense]
MKIISASYILTCNDKFEILTNSAVCFDKTILDIDKLENLSQKYPEAEVIELPKNSVLMPGLINTHVHLEFSSNKSSLKYGNFMTWLNSVIAKRDDLLSTCNDEVIEKQLKIMQKSGTTTFGAISSFGNDFDACYKTPQRVVFFTEILGSQPNSVDILFEDFKSRLRVTEDNENERLIPAIAIHSPYSTHPMLARNALDIARKKGYVVSTHFMESQAEREWIDSGKGEFNDFFNNFAPNSRPMSSANDYIDLFYGTKTLFTHCVQANKKELEEIKNIGGSVTHCPVSNRLLGIGRLEIENIDKTMLNLGTDGLSSNISLNLWDEMRAALMMHFKGDLNKLAPLLIKMSTCNGAKALNLNCGEISKDKFADFIVCEVQDDLENIEDIALELILHTKFTKATYVAGEKI